MGENGGIFDATDLKSKKSDEMSSSDTENEECVIKFSLQSENLAREIKTLNKIHKKFKSKYGNT